MTIMAELYTHDFHAWALQAAELVRNRRFEDINLEELAEELEALGNQERKEVANRLVILLAHLLKWEFQPAHRGSSWRGTIIEQRKQIFRQLQYSPSIKPHLQAAIEDAYPDAVDIAVDETDLPPATFPSNCHYAIEQILDKKFFP
ncbi:conserved hypothetical protein [Gammaproteobacteria bacterium]